MAGLDGAAVSLLLERQLVGERAVGLLPAVGEQWRAGRGGCAPRRERPQARVPPQPLGARPVRRGPLRVADLVAARLEELRLGQVLQRDVQAVDPGHRLGRWRCGARASSSPPAAGSRRGASPPGRRRRRSTRPRPRARSGRRAACAGAPARSPPASGTGSPPTASAWRTDGRRAPGWRARSRGARRRGPPGRARPPAPPARAGSPSATGAAPPVDRGWAGMRSPISVHSGTSSCLLEAPVQLLERRGHGRLVRRRNGAQPDRGAEVNRGGHVASPSLGVAPASLGPGSGQSSSKSAGLKGGRCSGSSAGAR